MISYSQMLSRRARWLGLCLVAALAVAGWWQYRHRPPEGQTVFRPEGRIAQVVEIGRVLQSPALPSARVDRVELPCQGRSLRVLQARLVAALGWSQAQALDRLMQSAHQQAWSDCAAFSSAWQAALRLYQQDPQSLLTPYRVAQALTEDVSWTRKMPCLLAGSPQSAWLLAGRATECGLQSRFQTLASLPVQSSFRIQVAPLAQAATSAALSGRWSPEGSQWLSLQPDLHSRLDRWRGCLRGRRCEHAAVLAGLRNLALVILDAANGQVLGAWCDGPACDKARQQGAGVLPATLVEAPPASTSKLLFSLVLAQDPAIAESLGRQIKTSGQIDASVSKRNEWWEKQAICEGRQTPCTLPQEVDRLSVSMGLNAHCGRGIRAACGRWGLLAPDQPGVIPGQVGRMVLPATREVTSAMMDWKHYDDIRQGYRKPARSLNYERTALTVQAVIGGGDSRTTALGAAVVPMQIWRLSQGLSPVVPSVVLQSRPHLLDMPGSSANWRRQAATVLDGMRKVVEPPEPGWQGPGTAASAVELVMARPCAAACGLWAKTGTVSRQDRVFGGTTLLSAVVDTQAWSRWSGKPVPQGLENRVLALGVVAMPATPLVGTHPASLVGLMALKLVLSGEQAP